MAVFASTDRRDVGRRDVPGECDESAGTASPPRKKTRTEIAARLGRGQRRFAAYQGQARILLTSPLPIESWGWAQSNRMQRSRHGSVYLASLAVMAKRRPLAKCSAHGPAELHTRGQNNTRYLECIAVLGKWMPMATGLSRRCVCRAVNAAARPFSSEQRERDSRSSLPINAHMLPRLQTGESVRLPWWSHRAVSGSKSTACLAS